MHVIGNSFFILFVLIISCNKSDSDDFGFTNVYMPQAAMRDGGRTNNYQVPWSTTNGTKNYSVDSVANSINVVLGVYRAGIQDSNGFSVDVVTKNDTANLLISNGTLTNAVLLPADIYTLPASVTVPAGQRELTFYLKVDRKKLIEKYTAFSGKRLILAVGITNPSHYELNQSLSTTIIILDSKTFMP